MGDQPGFLQSTTKEAYNFSNIFLHAPCRLRPRGAEELEAEKREGGFDHTHT